MVGTSEGESVGAEEVGGMDGDAVGLEEVGEMDGEALGFAEGWVVGCAVGCIVGASVVNTHVWFSVSQDGEQWCVATQEHSQYGSDAIL